VSDRPAPADAARARYAAAVSHRGFSVEVVGRALATSAIDAVEVVQRFASTSAEVVRLVVRFADGRDDLSVIGKLATGAGLPSARRELAFARDIAPLWDSRAAALLGACDDGVGDAARLLLLFEDLGAAGYAVAGTGVTEAQLRGAIGALGAMHARFWDAVPGALLEDVTAREAMTRSARVGPPALIASNADAARDAAARFVAGAGRDITDDERAVLEDILAAWPGQLTARVAAGGVTLIHADFHFLGNIVFAAGDPRPRILDWADVKPGLGPHDVAYCLTAVPAADRPARDRALLRRYWDGLCAHGVRTYSWALCRWDHRFSLITNALQSLHQGSLTWFRHSLAMIEVHDARRALRQAPPIA
jgi:hypothetical protein